MASTLPHETRDGRTVKSHLFRSLGTDHYRRTKHHVCYRIQLNWTSVQFASTNLTRVTSVAFSQGGELIEFSGDNNRYPVVIANNINRPRCSITSGDVATLMSIAPGTSGTITATQNDAMGAVGGTSTGR